MIPTARLLFKFKERLNSLSSNKHQEIPDQEALLMLNEALLKLVKQKIGPNNVYGMGIDSFRKRYQDLQVLVVPHVKNTAVETDSVLSSFNINLPNKLFIPLHIYVTASKGICKNRVMNVAQIVPHSDVMNFLGSTHHRPSFNYEETFGVISQNKLIVYSENRDEGNFTIDNIYLSYLRYPTPMELAGLPKLEGGVSSSTVDCELPEYLEDEILDIAIRQAGMNTDNQNAVQYAQLNQKDNE